MKKISTPLFKVALGCFLLILTIASCKKNDSTPQPVVETPVVTNVQPKNPSPGDVVTITGTGFGTKLTNVKVTIGAKVIPVTSVTGTQIQFTLPTGITAGDIAVFIKNVIAANTDPQKAAITPQVPVATTTTITSITPTSGKAGDVVTIVGSNFGTVVSDNVVKFNGIKAQVTGSVTSALTVTVPTGVTTGPVTVSVKGAAAITGPKFTVTTGTTGTGTAVPYVITVGGTATFSKIATAPSEIGAMVVDKENNVLYYSDYSPFASAHKGTLYKLKLDGSAPVAVTTDTKINTVLAIAADAAGNIYVVTGADQFGVKANIYKIDATTAAVTTIANNLALGGSGDTFNVDSKGGLWLGYGQKVNTTTATLDRNATFPYGSLHNALFQGDDIYVDDTNHLTNSNIGFYKYNLLTKVGAKTDFTLQGLFKQDNAGMGDATSGMDVQSKYALDGNENFYAMYPYAGDVASSANDYYVIRKTKNGNGGASTLVSKFYTQQIASTNPFVFYQQARLNTGLIFQADVSGNLYFKDNGTDIVKVTQ